MDLRKEFESGYEKATALLTRNGDDYTNVQTQIAWDAFQRGATFNREYLTQINQIAKRLHYPQCWDTAAYPTLYDAIMESIKP